LQAAAFALSRLGAFLLACLACYAIFLSILALLFRGKGRGLPAGDSMATGGPDDPLDRLFSIFEAKGYFPTYLRLCISGDVRYPPRAMLEDFVRDRDIRLLVALMAPPQLLLRKEKPAPFSLPIPFRGRFTAPMCFTLFDSLIAEAVMKHSGALQDAPARARCHALVDRIVADLLSPPGGFRPGKPYLYRVSFDPRVPNRILNGVMRSWSAYDDTDSSAFVLSFFAEYLRQPRKDAAFSALSVKVGAALARTPYPDDLVDVHRPAEPFTLPIGRPRLAPGSACFLTYFTQGANDADPVVNMDILHALCLNWDRWEIRRRTRLLECARQSLAYIRAFADNGSLFRHDVHQYYSAPACAFLWKRFLEGFSSLPPEDGSALDPDGHVSVVDARLEAWWEARMQDDSGFESVNAMDAVLLGAAFRGHPSLSPPLRARADRELALGDRGECQEFFCAVYPVKVIYGNPSLMRALTLYFRGGSARPSRMEEARGETAGLP
jgi:hypothetical protein